MGDGYLMRYTLLVPSANPSTDTPTGEATGQRAGRRRASITRQAVLDSALSLFAQNGYAGTSMDDIGRAAAISGPAIYRHFANKEEILVEAFRTVGAAIMDPLESLDQLEPSEAF